ncbi:hypothetical protein BDV06DRAFT_218396 [Aspergillus oleicola]
MSLISPSWLIQQICSPAVSSPTPVTHGRATNVPLQTDFSPGHEILGQILGQSLSNSFSGDSAKSIIQLQDVQEDTDLYTGDVRNAINISIDGWTSNELYEEACSRARQVKALGITALDTEYERDMARRHWPFDDFDEDE